MDTQVLRLAILSHLVSKLDDAGKTQLQKLVYFLQEGLGLPTKYRFKMYHYGPYSDDLDTDMSRLKFNGYVDIQPDPKGYGFHITPLDEAEAEWPSLVEPYGNELSWTLNIFGNKPAYELELAATIHFVNTLLSQKSADGSKPSKDEVVKVVKGMKPKFDISLISGRYSELEELALLK